jgi:hypothetical protein
MPCIVWPTNHGDVGIAFAASIPFANHAPPRLGQEGRAILL